MDFSLRKARKEDVERIMEIMSQAKAQMACEGSRQWDESYPAPENILADIEAGVGYVLCESAVPATVVAYGAIVLTGEPAYDEIDGQWLKDDKYVVLHRLAVADEVKGRGVATRFFMETARIGRENGAASFRVDTNFDNARMLHIADKLGFTYCGEVLYRRGSRKAFEKEL